MKITQGFCRKLAKRARQGKAVGLTLVLTATLSYIVYAQSRGTPSQLRVKIDATGALAVSSAGITNPLTTVVFDNARLKVDSNGYLVITDGGGAGFAPANLTYIIKTANASLSNAQSLGALTSGLLFNTVTAATGVLTSIAGGTNCIIDFTSATAGSCTSSPLIGTSVSSPIIAGYSSVTHDSIYFLNTNTYWQNGRYSSTNLGAELFGLTKNVGNPGISVEAFMNTGGTRKATSPMVQFYTYYNSSGASLGDVWGQLYGWFNFSEEAKAVIWCSTDQTNCSSAVGAGSLKYIYEFSNDSNSLFKTSQITIMNSKGIIFNTDNAGDIGAVGATRPRTGYFGTSVISPTYTASNGAYLLGTATGSGGQYIEGWEQSSDPSAPAANAGRIFFKDNGAGKTQACVRFNTGATQCFATEP